MSECVHGNRFSECQQCLDEIPAFLRRSEPNEVTHLRARIAELEREREALMEVVNEQAEDDGLWFVAESITEDMLQRALRRLHAAAEGERT